MKSIRIILCAALIAMPSIALAKTSRNLEYRYNVIWSSIIRLLRADLGYKITDRDKESGYLLFVYPGQGEVKLCPASMEVLPIKDREGSRILVQLTIAHQPSYIEIHLLDQLEDKLREEQGLPSPQPVKKPRPDQPRDKDKDKDKNKNKDTDTDTDTDKGKDTGEGKNNDRGNEQPLRNAQRCPSATSEGTSSGSSTGQPISSVHTS